MNRSRKFIALLLAAMLLLAALPATGLAENYTIKALTQKKWLTFQDYYDHTTAYKLKVTGETVLSYSWKNADTSGLSYIEIFRDKACTNSVELKYLSDSATGANAFVLYAGTYYIKTYDYNEKTKAKFTVRKAATINKANYCTSKATTVKAGKKVEIAQTKKNNYTRWYRIKLTKTKSITITGMDQYSFTLYDSNMNEIRCSGTTTQCVTDGYQPKGTYYLAVNQAYLSQLTKSGQYIAFSWK